MIMFVSVDVSGPNRFCTWLHTIIPGPRDKDEQPVEEVHVPADELRGRAAMQRIRLAEAEARLYETRQRRIRRRHNDG